MLEIFDGFIDAVSSEFHIPFKKENDGEYSAMVEFEGGRHQRVLISFGRDDQGDPMISYYSVICKLDEPSPDLFREALLLNTNLTYGAIALMDDNSLIMHQATFLKDLEPQRFIKSFLYVAAKADELEEQLTGEDIS
ncbi:MAG: YbjN domain-containing protein [Spirochaetia bacterium]|nr:YbjN domain-containing protein [Spirochaetia bacterium]